MVEHNLIKKAVRKKKVGGKKRPLFILASLFLVFFLVLVGLTVFAGTRIFSGVSSASEYGEDARTHFLNSNFELLKDDLSGIKMSVEEVDSGVKYLFWMKPIPWLGDQIKGAEVMLEVLIDELEVMEQAFHIAGGFLETMEQSDFSELSSADRKDLIRRFGNIHGDLQRINTVHEISLLKIEDASRLKLYPDLRTYMDFFGESLETTRNLLVTLITFSAAINELSGVDGGTQILLLFADSSYSGSVGGRVDMSGLFLVEDGRPVNVNPALGSIDLTYEVPDFEVLASKSVVLLHQKAEALSQPKPEVHAVITLTPSFIAEILSITEGLVVGGTTVNQDTAEDLLFEDKNLTMRVVSALIEKVFTFGFEEILQLSEVFVESAKNKDVAIYSFNESVQAAYRDAGWAGTVKNGHDDLFASAFSNTSEVAESGIKSDVQYKIRKDGDNYIGTAVFTYENLDTQVLSGVLHLLAPDGSQLLESSREAMSESLGDYQHFAFSLEVPGGEKGVFELSYILPLNVVDAIHSNVYQLEVYKQLGVDFTSLTLDLDFGKNIRAAVPVEDKSEFGDTKYRLNTILVQDSVFTIEL